MKKGIIIFLISLFFLSAFFIAFPSDVMKGIAGGKLPFAYLLIASFLVTVITRILESVFPSEYETARKLSHTPYAKYGWYALIFSIVFFAGFYLYAYLSSFVKTQHKTST